MGEIARISICKLIRSYSNSDIWFKIAEAGRDGTSDTWGDVSLPERSNFQLVGEFPLLITS